jgi:large subunit ribosomal protein L25
MHKVEVECLPRNIPEHIIVDISGLNLNDSIHISDLKYDNIEFTDPQESLIVQVTHAKIKEEVAPVAAETVGEEAAEPEVISKGKQEEKEEEK